jgi:hypothetical protein
MKKAKYYAQTQFAAGSDFNKRHNTIFLYKSEYRHDYGMYFPEQEKGTKEIPKQIYSKLSTILNSLPEDKRQGSNFPVKKVQKIIEGLDIPNIS